MFTWHPFWYVLDSLSCSCSHKKLLKCALQHLSYYIWNQHVSLEKRGSQYSAHIPGTTTFPRRMAQLFFTLMLLLQYFQVDLYLFDIFCPNVVFMFNKEIPQKVGSLLLGGNNSSLIIKIQAELFRYSMFCLSSGDTIL